MDVYEGLRLATAEFVDRVAQLSAEVWRLPTPCPDFDVRALVNHVVVGNRFAVRLLQGVSAQSAVAGLETDLLGSDPAEAVRESCGEQVSAFERLPSLQVEVDHPSGRIAAAVFLRFRVGDLTVHAWDVARSAALDEVLHTGLVEHLWTQVSPVTVEMAASGAYGDGASGTRPADASPQRLLLDAYGRRP